MKKLMKAVAALMLMTAAVCVAGCTKPDGPNTGGDTNEGTVNGHEYVDLGLPSGTLWATCNVGADSPDGYGDYFAWGETELKEVFEWDTYKYCNGGYNQLTKYCNNVSYGFNGFADDLTSLQEDDDVAATHWGEGWRTPSCAEWDELTDFCTQTWTTRNGIYGRLFTAPNGNSLFLPVAGYRSSSSSIFDGEHGFYWSSSLNVDDPNIARVFSFHSDNFGMTRGFLRYYGLSIRPVHSAK